MTAPRLHYFDYDNLPMDVQYIAKKFKDLMEQIIQKPDVDEIEIENCIRHLLDARTACLRAYLAENN